MSGGGGGVLRRLQRCVLSRCRGSHLTRVDTAGEEFVQLDQFVWGDVELERDAVEGIVRSHLWWHMRWVTEGTQRRKFPPAAHQSVGLFQWLLHALLLTVNSTVPGGLLFSFFAWFSLLQPSSTSEQMRKLIVETSSFLFFFFLWIIQRNRRVNKKTKTNRCNSMLPILLLSMLLT